LAFFVCSTMYFSLSGTSQRRSTTRVFQPCFASIARAARTIEAKHGWKARVVDLRWLVPLNEAHIVEQAKTAKRIIIVDEGRHSAGVGEGVITAIAEGGFGARPFQRVVGVDTYTPLAGAAFLVIPGEDDIVTAAGRLA
jgi:2-oxoisovalerate dehydrogenase E1 component